MLAAILQPINQGVGKPQLPEFTFKDFVDSVYLPVYRGKWKASTAMTEEGWLQVHLVGSFSSQVDDQDYPRGSEIRIEQEGEDIVAERRRSSAVSPPVSLCAGRQRGWSSATGGFVVHTARNCKKGVEKLVLAPEDISRMTDVLDLRERLVVRLATFEGMRPGEILGLQVGDIDGDSVWVRRRIYKGNIDVPKTRRSARRVDLSAATAGDKIPLEGVDITVVTSNGELIENPITGGGSNDSAICRDPVLKRPDAGENGRSVGFLLQIRRF